MNKKNLCVVANIKTGKLDANAAEVGGRYPFFTCGEKPDTISYYAYDLDAILLAGNNAQGNFHIQRYKGKFNAYQRTYIITAKDGYDIDYIKYSIEIALNHLKKVAQGSQTKFLTIEILNNFHVDDISLGEQQKLIAGLKAIDKKIEINNAINDNLQQIVKAVFDFRFAKQKPNGKLFQIVNEHEKSTVQVGDSEGVAGKYPFFTSGEAVNEWETSMVDGVNCFLATGGNATIKVYSGKAAYSTDTWCISGKGEYSAYLYFYLKSIINSINTSYFAGSGLKHLQKEGLLLVDLYLPSHEELVEFNKVAIPALNQYSELFRETKLLEKQRNFLLPMLMNGQATIAE